MEYVYILERVLVNWIEVHVLVDALIVHFSESSAKNPIVIEQKNY